MDRIGPRRTPQRLPRSVRFPARAPARTDCGLPVPTSSELHSLMKEVASPRRATSRKVLSAFATSSPRDEGSPGHSGHHGTEGSRVSSIGASEGIPGRVAVDDAPIESDSKAGGGRFLREDLASLSEQGALHGRNIDGRRSSYQRRIEYPSRLSPAGQARGRLSGGQKKKAPLLVSRRSWPPQPLRKGSRRSWTVFRNPHGIEVSLADVAGASVRFLAGPLLRRLGADPVLVGEQDGKGRLAQAPPGTGNREGRLLAEGLDGLGPRVPL